MALKKVTRNILARTKHYKAFTNNVKGSPQRMETAKYLRKMRKEGHKKTYGPYGSGK